MARVTHVKKAQQRYHTKPVLDENGQQKKVPVMNPLTGEQKTTKNGRPVFMGLTERDLERPKPLLKCGSCHEDIQLGTPYKWIQPHGQAQLSRHASCPSWKVWEYSNSLDARIQQIQDGEPSQVESPDDIKSWMEEKAEAIRELAEEKRESASNIEDGFGHETEQSSELNDIAEQLDSWADDLEQVDIPELPEPEEEDCGACEGSGHTDSDDGRMECPECDGSGTVEAEEPSEEAVAEWSEEAIQAVRDLLDQAPV